MTQNVVNDLRQAITLNTDAMMQMDLHNYVPKGGPVEVGLLQFVSESGIAIQERFIDREDESKFKLMAWIPFSSARRVMTCAYIDMEEDENKVKVVMKGAPEEILARCSQGFD